MKNIKEKTIAQIRLLIRMIKCDKNSLNKLAYFKKE